MQAGQQQRRALLKIAMLHQPYPLTMGGNAPAQIWLLAGSGWRRQSDTKSLRRKQEIMETSTNVFGGCQSTQLLHLTV